MGLDVLIYPDEYLGIVKLNNEWKIYHDVVSMWVLNYKEYDDLYEPINETDWRYGIMQVDEKNAEDYCKALSKNELTMEQVILATKVAGSEREPLSFVVNFDERIFVNGWYDMLPIHTWTPSHWKSLRDSPYPYIPQKYRDLWQTS